MSGQMAEHVAMALLRPGHGDRLSRANGLVVQPNRACRLGAMAPSLRAEGDAIQPPHRAQFHHYCSQPMRVGWIAMPKRARDGGVWPCD